MAKKKKASIFGNTEEVNAKVLLANKKLAIEDNNNDDHLEEVESNPKLFKTFGDAPEKRKEKKPSIFVNTKEVNNKVRLATQQPDLRKLVPKTR